MTRNRIGGNNTAEKEFEFFKPSPPSGQKQLFAKTAASSLSRGHREYLECAEYLKEFTKKGSSAIPINTNKVCSFFVIHYKFRYGIDCIDYNIMNAKNTFERLAVANGWQYYELLLFIYESFEKYELVRHQLNLGERHLTVSTFKRQFIVDALISKTSNIKGFY